MRKKIERKMKESEPQLQGGERPVRLTKGNGRSETQLPSSSRWGSVLWGGGRGLLSTSLLARVCFPFSFMGIPEFSGLGVLRPYWPVCADQDHSGVNGERVPCPYASVIKVKKWVLWSGSAICHYQTLSMRLLRPFGPVQDRDQ